MLLSFITHLLIGFVLSFIGSIPFGLINITVADTAIKKGLKAGLWVGFGAAVIEFFQSFVAIKFTDLFANNPAIDFYFNIIALVVFFALAIFHLFLQKPKLPHQIQSDRQEVKPFFKGLMISSVNVLVFPYWIFYATYLSGQGWLNLATIHVSIFCLGIFLGAFSVFAIFAKLGTFIIKKGPSLMNAINISIGFIFLGFGIFQLWKLVQSLSL